MMPMAFLRCLAATARAHVMYDLTCMASGPEAAALGRRERPVHTKRCSRHMRASVSCEAGVNILSGDVDPTRNGTMYDVRMLPQHFSFVLGRFNFT